MDRETTFNNSGLNKTFRPQFDAIWNTYENNLTKPSSLDRFANWLGFRSGADSRNAQLQLQRDEAIQQLIGLQREQTYNSEAEQAQRMRAAGLNPDLQGIGDAAQASEFTEPEQSPDAPNYLNYGAIGNGFMKAFENALGLYSGFLDIQGKSIANDAADWNKMISILSGSPDIISSIYDPASLQDWYTHANKGGFGTAPIIGANWFDAMGIKSDKRRKRVQNLSDYFFTSFLGKKYMQGELGKYLENEQKIGELQSKWYMNGNNNEFGFQASDIVRPMKAFNTVLHELESEQAKFNRDYYKELKADKKAEAENVANEWNKKVNETKKKMIDSLLGDNPTPFGMALALQLMGQTDFLGNTGIKDLIGGLTRLIPNTSNITSNFTGNITKMTGRIK